MRVLGVAPTSVPLRNATKGVTCAQTSVLLRNSVKSSCLGKVVYAYIGLMFPVLLWWLAVSLSRCQKIVTRTRKQKLGDWHENESE